jgi:hypothetical protein
LRTDGDACASLNAVSSTATEADAVDGLGIGDGAEAAAAGDAFGGAGAAAGAFAAGGADADVGAAAGFDAFVPDASPPSALLVSTITIGEPSRTLSPTLTRTSLIVPDAGDGTSSVALSDSSVMSESSAFTASPGLTKISMIGMSVKSPISGTFTSNVLNRSLPAGK